MLVMPGRTKRPTGRTTVKRTTKCTRFALGIALAAALVPGSALAAQGPLEAATIDSPIVDRVQSTLTVQAEEAAAAAEAETQLAAGNKLLAYDPADIAAIGTQAATGHTICCPSFSCAYADAVMDGTVHGHEYYTCSCCSWADWGGGNSSFRSVGTDEQLLREAHDQIAAGRPTVIHVRASYGEHWIALIGFEGATDPDHLTLANFTALDPWDGAQINAASRFSLYGDGCEHISDRNR